MNHAARNDKTYGLSLSILKFLKFIFHQIQVYIMKFSLKKIHWTQVVDFSGTVFPNQSR